ncbi:MAG TPA: hypothetical protein VN132_04195, partial [Bdellovibrio sp.]|nr:hypothetical protein [Bdellovibrio sp.]
TLAREHSVLENTGYVRWEWMKSECDSCEMLMLPTQPKARTQNVLSFVRALEVHKTELQQLYHVSGAEYTLLSHMAVGILGRESLFFASKRYYLKESVPGAVRLAKILEHSLHDRKMSPSSRGPTQIKIVPAKVAERYGIAPDNLHIPENAAIATVAFLIEALQELKRRVIVNQLGFIQPSNYVDYLPYIYFGGVKSLVNGTAAPASNSYINDMKRYMTWFEVYEREPSRSAMN